MAISQKLVQPLPNQKEAEAADQKKVEEVIKALDGIFFFSLQNCYKRYGGVLMPLLAGKRPSAPPSGLVAGRGAAARGAADVTQQSTQH